MLADVLAATASAQSRVIREAAFKCTSHWTPGMKSQVPATPLALPMPHNVNGALVLREVVHC